ncbi:MAG TPA: NADP-dependent oxidoreductase [Polyangia bacterium]|jgi:NADPH2:quinone reductase|nr:NADP-dependent oxidoreductase [Polyangia bacterium]
MDKVDASIPQTMRAAAIDHFGGPEVLHTQTLPVPKPKRNEVLIRLDAAGIGVWDPFVREGGLETGKHEFPFVIGSDGAGTVVAIGPGVTRVKVADRVYAYSMKGGFYAEYVAVSEAHVAAVPAGVKPDEAGALGADGITALRGLEDHLRVKGGETLMIFGASGGIGHLALQLAKRMGARVLAVASGPDGVELVRRLGADVAVDGQKDDVARAAKEFAPDGLDVALVLVAGKGLGEALALVKKGGRIAHPNGVEPKPHGRRGVKIIGYDGTPSPEAFDRLNRLIGTRPFHVELGRIYSLDEAALAHRQIEEHHLGKMALRLHA